MLFPLLFLNALTSTLFGFVPKLPYRVIDVLIMILPSIGYLDTVRLMIATKSAAAYDLKLILIVSGAHGMKIMFFFFHGFPLMVFGQSVTIFISAVTLTFLRFRYPASDDVSEPIGQLRRILCIWHNSSFPDFIFSLISYCFLLILAVSIGSAVAGYEIASETLGVVANLVELMTAIPIFLQVVVRRDTRISLVLILQYAIGDFMRFVLFILVKAPWMFIAGAGCSALITGTSGVTFFLLKAVATGPTVETCGVDVDGDTAKILAGEQRTEERSDGNCARDLGLVDDHDQDGGEPMDELRFPSLETAETGHTSESCGVGAEEDSGPILARGTTNEESSDSDQAPH
jgi:hypothetical protein